MAKFKLPAEAREFFREHGRKGGKLSGPARMSKLTPEQRSAIAKEAVAAREAKRRRRVFALAFPPGETERLKALLATLPATQGYLVKRVYFDGDDIGDLAKFWGVPEAQLSGLLQAGMRSCLDSMRRTLAPGSPGSAGSA